MIPSLLNVLTECIHILSSWCVCVCWLLSRVHVLISISWISVWFQDCSNIWEGQCNVYAFFPPLFYYLFIYTFILEKGMANHSSILAWRIPWTEEPGGLKSMGSQRVRHIRATEHMTCHWAQHTYLYLYRYITSLKAKALICLFF